MRKLFKPIIIVLLAAFSRAIVRKYRPKVVMVTGSVGKTSTKDAVAAALSEKFYLRKSEKGYNTEFGVPLTIIGSKNAWGKVGGWFKVIDDAFAVLFLPNHYPKMLVLEVGADQPGDLARMMKLVTPDAVVVTLLPEIPVHVEAYPNPEAVREEEFTPATALPQGAPLIINADDHYALEYATRTSARVYTFGLNEGADVRILKTDVWIEGDEPKGMQAILEIQEESQKKSYAVQVPGSFGQTQLLAPAAAVATGLALGLTPAEALSGLRSYVPPPGRGKVFAGLKRTILIDDSYNASPVAVEAILRSLCILPSSRRKVAILGDMLELGRYSIEEHERIGHIAKDCVSMIITVGTRSKVIGEAAIKDGMSQENVHHFANSLDAALAVPDLLNEKDIVLIKGSQTGVRLERVVKVLLKDEKDAANLVRQDAEWQRR
jgi:UDP-N-acetylmuramoyl-tripeptide--D-alanyl-D-alanine ligase